MSDEKDRDKDGSRTPPLSSSSSSSSRNQRAPNDVWNNPQLLRLNGEIDSVAADIKAKEGKMEVLRREKRKASSPQDKADFQEEIDELKQSIADLKAEKNKLLDQRDRLTQSLSGNTGSIRYSKSRWQHLNIPLPQLTYQLPEIQSQDKSTTKFAAHSHTPIEVKSWVDFRDLMVETGNSDASNETIESIDIQYLMQQVAPTLQAVREEEHVTQNTCVLLNCASEVLGVEFVSGNKYFTANTDITVLGERVTGLTITDDDSRSSSSSSSSSSSNTRQGSAQMYVSPVISRRKARTAHMDECKSRALFPIETKPFWKYGDIETLEEHWIVPDGKTDSWKLPSDCPVNQKKIFHLLRQVYGQMVEDNRKYGVIHTYERWWFCKRNDSTMFISEAFLPDQTNPSVVQALWTLSSQDGFELTEWKQHSVSPIKARSTKTSSSWSSSSASTSSTPSTPTTTTTIPTTTANGGESLCLSKCHLLMTTENVKLLLSPNRRIMVKMIRNPMSPQAAELRHEANIYRELIRADCSPEALPTFFDYKEIAGVPCLCVSAEGEDFEDIGLENLSESLKTSAVAALQSISDCGVLHGDLALRNIVRSQKHPDRAKIIDFGRARVTKDKSALDAQLTYLRNLLCLRNPNF